MATWRRLNCTKRCFLCDRSGTLVERNVGTTQYFVCGGCVCSKCGLDHHTSKGEFVPDCEEFAERTKKKRAKGKK